MENLILNLIKIIWFKRKQLIFLVFIILTFKLFDKLNSNTYSLRVKNDRKYNYKKFINDINEDRINKLFRILQKSENKYVNNLQSNQSLENKLNLISFNRIKKIKTKTRHDEYNIDRLNSDDKNNLFKHEIENFLEINQFQNIVCTTKFVNYLRNKSEYFSYRRPRECIFSFGSCKPLPLDQV